MLINMIYKELWFDFIFQKRKKKQSFHLYFVQDILRHHPYHIDALMHLSDVSRMQDDTPTAVDLIGKKKKTFHLSSN